MKEKKAIRKMMAGKKAQTINGSVWKMALKQFSDATTKSKPEITGGCVVTTIASLAMTLLIMPLEISARKNKDIARRAQLKEKIAVLKKIKKRLIKAADDDLNVFNQYRFLGAGYAKENAEKLKYKALVYATKSPFKVASLVKECFSASIDCVTVCNANVISDFKAAVLLLHSSFSAILALAQGNMNGLKDEDLEVFEQLRLRLEQEVSVEITTLLKKIDGVLQK